MRIQYNYNFVRLNAESIWGELTGRKKTAELFRQLDMVQWLEENIGELYEPVPGEMLHGIGWYVITEFEPGGRGTLHYLDVDDGLLSEHQITEFLLRFG